MILPAGIEDSTPKSTRRFLLASTAGIVASRQTRRFWKTGAELDFVVKVSCCRQLAPRKQLLLLARFRVVDCLLGGSTVESSS